jgi:hypothetical protein
MLIPHAVQQLRTVAGVRDWACQSAPAPSMRIPDRGDDPFRFVVIAVSGWMNDRQLLLIEHL